MDLFEQEFSLFPLVWSGPSKIPAGNYCLIPTVHVLTIHCEIWSDAPDFEACLIWRSKMWPLLCVFLFLILSPDFAAAAAAAVVVVRGGGAGGETPAATSCGVVPEPPRALKNQTTGAWLPSSDFRLQQTEDPTPGCDWRETRASG